MELSEVTLEFVEKLLKSKRLRFNAAILIKELLEKYQKFNQFTENQKLLIIKIAKEHRLLGVASSYRIPETKPHETFVVKEHPKSVLSDEERKEIFQFMRDTVSGKYSKSDANKYAHLVADLLKERGVIADAWN